MIVVRDVAALPPDARPCVVALGAFDGVHLGHQAVLRRVIDAARQSSHVAIVVNTMHRGRPALGCFRQHVQRIAAYGIDVLCLMRRSSDPHDASARAVVTELSAKRTLAAVVLGVSDRWRSDLLWRGLHTRAESVPMVSIDGEEVTSDGIRAAVVAGDLSRAQQRLGAPYAVGGHVVPGLRRGRTLGFPTANLRLRNVLLPPNGVYVVSVQIGGVTHRGVANLGINPTFGDVQRTLETHIFDFDEELYARYIEVTFVAFLREERKFPSIDALVEQIRSDALAARRLLS
jgi:riboflavin kinase / FMN adenylyltransferase